jgi:glycosyltransferase involved in cell wall biosynthesis
LTSPKRICLIPKLTETAGPGVFQNKLALGLKARGVETTFDLKDKPYSAVLVIGGTKNLSGLWRARRSGAKIVQRLDGMNWIHRLRRTGMAHYLRAEYGNLNLRLIRARMADHLVYQSEFARGWWERTNGLSPAPARVIYNGVDLRNYSPNGPEKPPDDHYRVLVVEGKLAGGYDVGLEHAIELVRWMNGVANRQVELMVAGIVPPGVVANAQTKTDYTVSWAGHLPPSRIPSLDRAAHLLFSADLNAACPNAVIEAMACGLPVLSLDSGALPELVSDTAGIIAPYGGNPWLLDPPDLERLAQGGMKILANRPIYSTGARARAEAFFGLDEMASKYLELLG